MRIRATMTLRNDKVIGARERHCLTQRALADVAEVPISIVAQIEAMDYTSSRVMIHAERVAGILDLDVNDVVPSEALGKALLNRAVAVAEVSPLELANARERLVKQVSPHPVEALIEQEKGEEAMALIRMGMDGLPHRDQHLLEMRWGLRNGGAVFSLSECGKVFNLSRARIAQIELNAKRRIKRAIIIEQKINGEENPYRDVTEKDDR